MGSVDVVMLTKNSEYMLEKSLQSIYENVPLNTLIIVDGFSTDRTLSIIKKYSDMHRNIDLVFDKGTRAMARQRGIEKVKTEWFMFVDSDVVLCKGWFRKAWRLIDDKVGAVWGIEVPADIKHLTLLRIMTSISMRSFKIRGGAHDVLIRHEAVRDIKIPENLHVYEDAFIKKWIINKGYKVIAAEDPYCKHYRPSKDWTIKRSVSSAALEIKHGFRHHHTFFYLFAAFYWFLQKVLAMLPSTKTESINAGKDDNKAA